MLINYDTNSMFHRCMHGKIHEPLISSKQNLVCMWLTKLCVSVNKLSYARADFY